MTSEKCTISSEALWAIIIISMAMMLMGLWWNWNDVLLAIAMLQQVEKVAVVSSRESIISLGINPNSTIALDMINSVMHVPERFMIVLHLNKQRNCSHPQLIGRKTCLGDEESDYD